MPTYGFVLPSEAAPQLELTGLIDRLSSATFRPAGAGSNCVPQIQLDLDRQRVIRSVRSSAPSSSDSAPTSSALFYSA